METIEELEKLYFEDNLLFMAKAKELYKKDLQKYNELYYPIIKKNNQPKVEAPVQKTSPFSNLTRSTPFDVPTVSNRVTPITCPFCKTYIYPQNTSKTSTGGILMIVAGICLTPVLVGIILIFIGMSMKDNGKECPACRMKLQ